MPPMSTRSNRSSSRLSAKREREDTPIETKASKAAKAKGSSTAAAVNVPIIDIGGLFSNKLEDRMKVAKEIGAACKDIGFFVIVNHGVKQDILDDMWRETAAFFDRPGKILYQTIISPAKLPKS